MKKTVPSYLFYGNFNHFLCGNLLLLDGNYLYFLEISSHFMEFSCTSRKICVTFMEINCHLRKICVTRANQAWWPLAPERLFTDLRGQFGRLGSVGVGRGTFSTPIRAPESDRSKLWKITFLDIFIIKFHVQICTSMIYGN